jgi:hypothetical protein
MFIITSLMNLLHIKVRCDTTQQVIVTFSHALAEKVFDIAFPPIKFPDFPPLAT